MTASILDKICAPDLGDVILVSGRVFFDHGAAADYERHAAIVCDVRAIEDHGTFRASVFRFGGDPATFTLRASDRGRMWWTKEPRKPKPTKGERRTS